MPGLPSDGAFVPEAGAGLGELSISVPWHRSQPAASKSPSQPDGVGLSGCIVGLSDGVQGQGGFMASTSSEETWSRQRAGF